MARIQSRHALLDTFHCLRLSGRHHRSCGDMRAARIDKPLALLIGILVIGGAFIFASAVFGLLARGSSNMSSVVFNHAALGIGVGLIALLIASRIPCTTWKRFAPHLFV